MRHSKLVLTLLASALIAMGACADDGDSSSGAAGGGAGEEVTGSLTIGFSSAADVGDLATLMAIDRLTEEGIEVESVFFSQPELVTQALLSNDIDVAVGAITTALAAVEAQDAPLSIFLNQIRNEWVLWSKTNATSCDDLEGESIGVHSTSGASYYMVRTWFQEDGCADPEYTVVPGSDARAAAMIAGEMDTSLLEIGDALLVESERPDDYQEVVNFSEELPNLLTISFFTTENFLASNADLLGRLAEAVATTNAELAADPETAAAAVPDYLESANDQTRATAEAYAELELWPTDPALTEDAISYSLDFYTAPAAEALDGSGIDRLRAAFDLSVAEGAGT